MSINQSTAFRGGKIKIKDCGVGVGEINSSSLSDKTIFMKYNTHIQEYMLCVPYTYGLTSVQS